MCIYNYYIHVNGVCSTYKHLIYLKEPLSLLSVLILQMYATTFTYIQGTVKVTTYFMNNAYTKIQLHFFSSGESRIHTFTMFSMLRYIDETVAVSCYVKNYGIV